MDCELVWELVRKYLRELQQALSTQPSLTTTSPTAIMNVSVSTNEIRDILIDVIRQEFKSGITASLSIPDTLADLQSELDKTKQLLEERTTELNKLKELSQEEPFENIDSKNRASSEELLPDATIIIPSNTTESPAVGTLLEEVLGEMKNVKMELSLVRDACSCMASNYADISPQVQDIRARTHEEEVQIITDEYEKALRSLEAPVDGDTLNGHSVPEISTEIPLITGNQVTLTIEIINRLSLPLTNLQTYIHSGEPYQDLPAMVKAGTREVATFRGGVPSINNVPGGAIAYRIGLTGVQLLLYYFNNKSKRSVMGFGLTLAELPVKTYFETCSLGCSSLDFMRPDKKYLSVESETTTTLVKLQNLRAKATINPSTRSIWTIEILCIMPESSPKAYLKFEGEKYFRGDKCLKAGESFAGKNISNVLADISTVYGCVVEISNGLKMSLENVSTYLFEGEQPQTILADSRELLVFTDNMKVEGLFTYQIQGTDLRIAVAIRCEESGNSFAIGFIPARTNTNQHLLDGLTDSSHWKTRPEKKYALAHEGPQVIEIRNIIAHAAMASEPKAMLKISVTTF
ncbi:unnamed protein product [Allacma fusca]|uniref:Uncharacterized protein n=1 Tax=Allacma fusca TaxID=39272 RepID=A0A8J2NQX8_9HEXA|nr:unnamed protein product [Allacma fusca]